MLRVLLSVVLLTFSSSLLAQTSSTLTFPRLGLMPLGDQPVDDPAVQAALSRYDMVILSIWPGWDGGRAMTMEASIRNIKSRNPKTKVFFYVNNMEMADGDLAWSEMWNKVTNERWWLYETGGSGTRVKSTYGQAHYLINHSVHTQKDISGESFIDYFTRFTVDKFLVQNPSADGFFLDNVFWKPRLNGDWNRDGASDDQENPVVQRWVRQGYRNQLDSFRVRAPGKLMIGNIADWGDPAAVFPELDRVLEGGVMESIIGQPYSSEAWAGWGAMMAQYRKMFNATVGPKLTIFSQDGSPTDYQGFRYGYASCLLDDAVYNYETSLRAPYVWFDEFDNKLGRALAGPSTSAWKNGVYRRDFERGIALVNPKGNGAVTVDLEQEYQRIAGRQDPAVNNGQRTRQVTLQDRDGIVLMRVTTRAVPLPPSGLRVE